MERSTCFSFLHCRPSQHSPKQSVTEWQPREKNWVGHLFSRTSRQLLSVSHGPAPTYRYCYEVCMYTSYGVLRNPVIIIHQLDNPPAHHRMYRLSLSLGWCGHSIPGSSSAGEAAEPIQFVVDWESPPAPAGHTPTTPHTKIYHFRPAVMHQISPSNNYCCCCCFSLLFSPAPALL